MNPAMAAAVRAARDNAADGSAAITPAPVLKAEFPDIIEIAGRTFLPFRLNTLRALQAVKSPIVAAAMGSEQTPLTDLDGLIAFWIFTTELPVVRETIGRGMTPCAALPKRSATRSNSATNSNWAKPSGCMFNPVSSPSSPPPRKTPI